MLGVVLTLGALALAVARNARTETGAARDWKRELERANRKQRKRDLRSERDPQRAATNAARRERELARRRLVDCCAADHDDYKAAGDTYRRWLPPEPMTLEEAMAECWRESQDFAAAGDYGKPADRRCWLGKLHDNKLAQWNDCRRSCSSSFGEASEAAFTSFADGVGVVWLAAGQDASARVTERSRGRWSVELRAHERAPWEVVDLVRSEATAHERARSLIDVPF